MKIPGAVEACDGFFPSMVQLRVMTCSCFTIPMQLLTRFHLELYSSGQVVWWSTETGGDGSNILKIFYSLL
jgi:hypothetical protein